MPVGYARKSDVRQSLRDPALQRFIQTSQQHGSGCSVSVHGDDGIAAGDEIQRARLVEAMAGKMQALEIVAGRPQPLEKVEAVLIAGDETRDFGSAPFNPPTVGRDHCDPGWLSSRDVHGVVDTFGVTLREIVVASKVVGRILTGHAPSLPLPNFSFSALCAGPACSGTNVDL